MPAGPYLLYVGSNSPTETRATLLQPVTLNSGANIVIGAAPKPDPDVTPAASQVSGSLRLMALSSVQQDCLSGANAGRASDSPPLLVPDEYLEEDAIAVNAEEDAQNTDQPSPLFGYLQPYATINGQATSSGFDPCTDGNPPYQAVTNAANIWYCAIVDETINPHFGVQLWMDDPR